MLGIHYETIAPQVEEGGWSPSELPGVYVERMSRSKALWVPRGLPGHAVLSADTIVFLDGEGLEKPADLDHARSLLGRLSGCWHEVYTGVCLRRVGDERVLTGHACSRVHFQEMKPEVVEVYLETGESMDKAGAYGIQGYGGLLIDRIEGCHFNVMGLPLHRLRELVHELEEA
jgi:septum formation protein